MSVLRAGNGERRWHSINFGSVATVWRKLKTGLNRSTWPTCRTQFFCCASLNQFGGLLGAVGHRLFDQNVFALLQQQFGEFKMRGGGCDNVQRVGGGSGLGDGVENAHIMFGGDFARGVGLDVEDAGEFHLAGCGEFSVNADVVLSQRPGAENGDFDL